MPDIEKTVTSGHTDLQSSVSFIQSGTTDFVCSISIVSPNLSTSRIQNRLSDDYTKSKNSDLFALLYGSGTELENTRQTLKQMEANNYLYSQSTQQGGLQVSSAGNYYIEFEIPFVVPPLSVSLSTTVADAYIEYTSQFGMVIVVTTDGQDIIDWTADGYVGAVTTEVLGDALYNNFGSIYNLPRQGPAVIDDSFVRLYEGFNTFLRVETIQPVFNFANGVPTVPPDITNFLSGYIRPTKAITDPMASYELINGAGDLLALLQFSGPVSMAFPDGKTYTVPVSSYTQQGITSLYPNATNFEVYVAGPTTTFNFDRWAQPAYRQEVFRADNEYRRLLAGMRDALLQGPNETGIADMVETLFSQPFIPSAFWTASDYRVFANTPGTSSPKYLTYTYSASGLVTNVASSTQFDGYPTVPPTIGVHRVLGSWSPDTITYANAPEIQLVSDIDEYQITQLNQASRMDITNELVRDMRVGLNLPEGGIINWNYLLNGQISSSGVPFYENGYRGGDTNYVFLNNSTDSIAGLSLFYYQKQSDPTGAAYQYRAYGPLIYGQDYKVVATSDLYNQATQQYNLPSDLLALHNYRADSAIPYANSIVAGTLEYWNGTQGTASLPASALPEIPAYVLKIDLSRFPQGTKFPVSAQDFLLYSYAPVTITNGAVTGNFSTDPANPTLVEYCDADTLTAIQPSETPFNPYTSVALSQGSFARFTSDSDYRYILTMVGGNVTFNKTININQLLQKSAVNVPTLNSPAIIDLIASSFIPYTGTSYYGIGYGINPYNYTITGTVAYMPNYVQNQTTNYVVVDDYDNVIALVDSKTGLNISYYVGKKFLVQGTINQIIWDTRIPVGDYRDNAPVFQAISNYGAAVRTFTPDPTQPLATNMNFQVIIGSLPEGFEETLTASWTFSIVETAQAVAVTSSSIGFPDVNYTNPLNNQSSVIQGIMTVYTGNGLIRQYGVEPDSATYTQSYTAPNFNAYFLNYKDLTATQYGPGIPPGKLSTSGDSQILDSLHNTYTTPNNVGTVLNFFSPRYGFVSMSILPGMEFFGTNGVPIDIVRPNNTGFALKILGDSYGGLVFYGKNLNRIVDKPTRLLVNYQYGGSQGGRRTKMVQLEDGQFGNWVNGEEPNAVMEGNAFFLAGNQYKFAGMGYDQAAFPQAPATPVNKNLYSLYANPPTYEVCPGGALMATPGQPQRYRRTVQATDTTYYTPSPEKLAFLKFNMDDFPIDTIVNRGEIELYFCSGFTINQAIHKNMTLNKNKLGPNARLSGNGTTAYKNVHWRKNFFEILLPYAFYSEPDNPSYGINGTVFQISDNVNVPKPTFPHSNLEYLGFINIDEIDTLPLTDTTNHIENTVGLSNVIISSASVVQQVVGVLNFETTPNGVVVSPGYDVTQISLGDVLPSMKVLIYPFGTSNGNNTIFLYGYVKSVLPPTTIGFTDLNISIYQQMFDRVRPLYSQYVFKLLESDTYFPYSSFGKSTSIEGTPQDISF